MESLEHLNKKIFPGRNIWLAVRRNVWGGSLSRSDGCFRWVAITYYHNIDDNWCIILAVFCWLLGFISNLNIFQATLLSTLLLGQARQLRWQPCFTKGQLPLWRWLNWTILMLIHRDADDGNTAKLQWHQTQINMFCAETVLMLIVNVWCFVEIMKRCWWFWCREVIEIVKS